MAAKTFLSVGECMIEMAQQDSGDWRMGFAGDTLNTAWYARACLPEETWRVSYFTRLGVDGFSDRILAFLDRNGIGTDTIGRDAERKPGLYLIEVKDGERSFTYWRDRSAAKLLADDPERLREAVGGADVVYFSGITLAILAPDRRDAFLDCMRDARRAGTLTVFDPNIRRQLWASADELRAALTAAAGAAAVTLPSFDDEQAAFGDVDPEACALRYREAGSDEVVVKNAGGPVAASAGSEMLFVSDLPRFTPLDSTGAGDSFSGAYLAARLGGKDIEAAVRAAHDVAGIVIRHRGALVDQSEFGKI
ncbi:MAG: sugar kinase [Rhodobiaceae bacterium]|nr:sugar kinase [Rhodobiaceae bacterium]